MSWHLIKLLGQESCHFKYPGSFSFRFLFFGTNLLEREHLYKKEIKCPLTSCSQISSFTAKGLGSNLTFSPISFLATLSILSLNVSLNLIIPPGISQPVP